MDNSAFPKYVKDDPRIGCIATDMEGFRGRIEYVLRFPDGLEMFSIMDEKGLAHGGLTRDQFTIEEEGDEHEPR